MRVTLNKISKRYTERWIIRNCSIGFQSDHVYGLIGPNGSGKSTLLKIIAGYLTPTKGKIRYELNGKVIHRDDIYRQLSMSAPYVTMQKQLTMQEMITFISKFKALRGGMAPTEFLQHLDIDVSFNMSLGNLSSGQFQKYGLATALLVESSLLLLDEPGSYLDGEAKRWFQELLEQNKKGRTIIIASNDDSDLQQATEIVDIRECW